MVPTLGPFLAVSGCLLTVRVCGNALDVWVADGDRTGRRQVEAFL
jgi:hypothetical protein